jgi:hypothetical protein
MSDAPISREEAARLYEEGTAAYERGDHQAAFNTFYGLYGSGVTTEVGQAVVALAIGQSLRRLGHFTEAESWFNEAMTAPGTNSDTQAKAAAGIRQARLENSGDAYDLDG